MIATNVFLDAIQKAGIEFISGVPDSLLKHICAGITNSYSSHNHIIATNEGSAVGLAIGHYLATSEPALVYMQNSGLGNVINPILSLADPEVYSIPMVLLIGWRGEIKDDNSQLTDEPQHKKQGKVTLPLLESIGIPYKILDGETDNVAILFEEIVKAKPDNIALKYNDKFLTYKELNSKANSKAKAKSMTNIKLNK